jgi:hypothetical protein
MTFWIVILGPAVFFVLRSRLVLSAMLFSLGERAFVLTTRSENVFHLESPSVSAWLVRE